MEIKKAVFFFLLVCFWQDAALVGLPLSVGPAGAVLDSALKTFRAEHPIDSIYTLPPGSSIQEAIMKANHHDTIIIPAGRYRESINFLGKDIKLQGIYAGNTIIEGTIFFTHGEQASLSNLTLLRGHPQPGFSSDQRKGAIVYIENSSPRITSCVIREGSATFGGGIYVCGSGSAPLIAHNTIASNRADFGGGIYLDPGVSCKIYGNRFHNNGYYYTGNGGAIYVAKGTQVLDSKDKEWSRENKPPADETTNEYLGNYRNDVYFEP